MRAALLVLVIAAGAWAGEPGRAELEAENRRLRDELDALRADDPAAVRRRAVDEYLSAHAAQPSPSDATLRYDRGFVLASTDGTHEMRLNAGVQLGWYRYRDTSEERTEARSAHRVTALRLRLSGHAFTKRLTYFFDFEFAPSAGRFSSEADPVAEAWIRYRRVPWDHLRLRGGRFRPHFSASESVDDFALAFVGRGLVNEFFTVGRTDGLAVQLENLRDGRSSFEFSMTNGSEAFDPDQPVVFDDKRYAFTLRWSRTLVGRGNPWDHTAFEGDPHGTTEGTLVAGIGVHWEDFDSPGARQAQYVQVTGDLTWRRAGTYACVQAFWRGNRAGGTPGLDADADDWGVQATVSRFVVPHRVELALRGGWIGYASHQDPGGDLVEVAFAAHYYWQDDPGQFPGQRLRVTLDIGWAENVEVESRWAVWPAGHRRGILFRSQVTVLF